MIAAGVSDTCAEAAAAVVTSSGVAVVTLCAPPPSVPGEDWAETGAWLSAAAACGRKYILEYPSLVQNALGAMGTYLNRREF